MIQFKSQNKNNSFFIADLHIGHDNILKYDGDTRGKFNNVYEHNELILHNCNQVLNDNSDLYILGDVFFGSKDVNYAANWLDRLNGKKHLVLGNHDQLILFNDVLQKKFERIYSYLEINFGKQLVCMFHYPIAEWNKCHRDSWMLYGHLHDHYYSLLPYKTKCVSVNRIGMKPISYNELEKYMEDKLTLCHHTVNQPK